jgi:hypothetical protein
LRQGEIFRLCAQTEKWSDQIVEHIHNKSVSPER